MRFARIDDIVVHHTVEGPADSPALVMANSLGTDFRVFGALVPSLAGRFRIVRYDKRGHGLSDLTPGPYSIDRLGRDLAGLLDHLGIERAVVCGLSVGGMIALRLAALRPELVRGLVLMDTAHKIGTAEMWGQRIEAVEKGGIEALADGVLERWFTRPFHDDRAAELKGWRNMLTRTPDEGYAAVCGAIRDADLTSEAQNIAVPTLCLAGAEDGSTPPEVVRGLADLVPGARFRVIDHAAHIIPVEQPEVTALEIIGFLEESRLV